MVNISAESQSSVCFPFFHAKHPAKVLMGKKSQHSLTFTGIFFRKPVIQPNDLLVGAFKPFEKYESNWIISTIFGVKIKKCLKPSTGLGMFFRDHASFTETSHYPSLSIRDASRQWKAKPPLRPVDGSQWGPFDPRFDGKIVHTFSKHLKLGEKKTRV